MVAQRITGTAVFEDLRHEWDRLASSAMTDTPFQHLAYQEAWWKHLKPADSELQSVVIRTDGNEPVSIGCFYLGQDGVLRFNGCVEETDYLDLITRAEDAAQAWDLTMDCMLSGEFPAWRRIELCNIPDSSPTRSMLPQAAARHDLTVVESVNEVCPIISLPPTFDEYLESLDSKQRRETKRKLRRAAGAGAQLSIVAEGDDLDTAVDQFLSLLQMSTFEKRDWLNEGRRALFHDVARAAQETGTLQLMFLEINQEKAAALFNFDYGNRIWVYNSGLDPQSFSALSPGIVITAKAIEWAIENGRDEFDFLRGDEDYKYQFGAKDTTIYRLQISR